MAPPVRTETQLERTLGLTAALMIGIGTMIGAGIFVLPGPAAAEAGPAIALSFVIGGVIALFTALTASELATAMPAAGGSYHFINQGLGPAPWLLGAPIFLGTVPSITLAGVPDFEADRTAGKKTIAVRFGVDRAATVAGVTALLAALIVTLWHLLEVVPDAYGPLVYLSVPHALGLVWLLSTSLDADAAPYRIDKLMIVSLSFVLWFGVVPLINLL